MGSSGPFAGAKWHFTEGGNRVPFLLRWPGVLAAGSVYSQPVMTFDLFPTFVAAAGGRMPVGTDIDGDDRPRRRAQRGRSLPSVVESIPSPHRRQPAPLPRRQG